jgi:hypothetical protein
VRACKGDKNGPSGLSVIWRPRELLRGGGVKAQRTSSAGYWSLGVAERRAGNR